MQLRGADTVLCVCGCVSVLLSHISPLPSCGLPLVSAAQVVFGGHDLTSRDAVRSQTAGQQQHQCGCESSCPAACWETNLGEKGFLIMNRREWSKSGE